MCAPLLTLFRPLCGTVIGRFTPTLSTLNAGAPGKEAGGATIMVHCSECDKECVYTDKYKCECGHFKSKHSEPPKKQGDQTVYREEVRVSFFLPTYAQFYDTCVCAYPDVWSPMSPGGCGARDRRGRLWSMRKGHRVGNQGASISQHD